MKLLVRPSLLRGEIAVTGSKSHTIRGIAAALVDRMEETAVEPGKQTIFISHGDCLEDAEHVRGLIAEKYPDCKFRMNYIGPVIGSHSGPGTVAVFFMGVKR